MATLAVLRLGLYNELAPQACNGSVRAVGVLLFIHNKWNINDEDYKTQPDGWTMWCITLCREYQVTHLCFGTKAALLCVLKWKVQRGSLCCISYVVHGVNFLSVCMIFAGHWQNDKHLRRTDSGWFCASIPFLTYSVFPISVLGWMRDVRPCCATGGRKRGLRRKLCRRFSFWILSSTSDRSFALSPPIHFGLGFGLWKRFYHVFIHSSSYFVPLCAILYPLVS